MTVSKKFIKSVLLISAFQFAPAVYADVSVPQHVVKQQAGGYSVQVGNVPVTSFTDGSIPLDLHSLLQRTTVQNTDKLLAEHFQANPVETSINAFLIELPGRMVLVDTGAGLILGPGNGGRLIESLATKGIQPEDITDILITHAHTDHTGGMMKDGQRVFVNAGVYIGKPDMDYLFNDENQPKAGDGKNYFAITQQTLRPYLDAGKIKPFSGTTAILPGISGTVHPGHTPGSAFYTLENAGEKITFIGDIIHAAAVQFPQPNVTIEFDENQDLAAKVRNNAFASFAGQKSLIAAPHIDFPGIGHIKRDGNSGYVWVPVTYTNRAGN